MKAQHSTPVVATGPVRVSRYCSPLRAMFQPRSWPKWPIRPRAGPRSISGTRMPWSRTSRVAATQPADPPPTVM
jgi:hypothetical protein